MEAEKTEARRSHNIVSCAGLALEISSEEIIWIIEYYNLDGKFMRPRHMMRMHHFNILSLPTPRMVITYRLIELGFGCLLHPFFHEVCEFYNVAHIQLFPNSYRLAIDVYIMYVNLSYEPPTMDELNFISS